MSDDFLEEETWSLSPKKRHNDQLTNRLELPCYIIILRMNFTWINVVVCDYPSLPTARLSSVG
jgi:hypothetical protein